MLVVEELLAQYCTGLRATALHVVLGKIYQNVAGRLHRPVPIVIPAIKSRLVIPPDPTDTD